MSSERRVVAIAGATGFVGQALRAALQEDHHVVGLTRSPTRAALADTTGVEWRHCDLFSMSEVQAALEGVDYAIYLVHSMLPSARLTQASFVDLDLLLADNFARAAEANGVRQIIYVGGIQPLEGDMSRHLQSRLEVESTLASRSVPITALRAGIILGPGGSSMRMMVNLVRRLPAMILPRWTRSESAPLAIDDVVRAVRRCLGSEDAFGQSFEIGGPERMSYRDMMKRTAALLGRRIPMLNVPVFSPRLSRRWVAWVSGAPSALVGPLVESLRHSVVPGENWLQRWLERDATPFDEALQRSLGPGGKPIANPRRALRAGDDARLKRARTVRSVQRLPLPAERTARWVAREYTHWLPRFMWPILAVHVSQDDRIHFALRGLRVTLLELTWSPRSSSEDRHLFHITGGVLARTSPEYRGRFEFREVLNGRAIIAAIHDFRPTLPWFVYNISQALVHLVVMRAFGRHLRAIAEGRRIGYASQALPAPSSGAAPALVDRGQAALPARSSQSEGDPLSSEGRG
jgi:uncharacterized protein YbjT (DUF2867 family)